MALKKSPWLQGKEAFWNGKSEKENPFPGGNVDALVLLHHQQWNDGYEEASNEASREEYSN